MVIVSQSHSCLTARVCGSGHPSTAAAPSQILQAEAFASISRHHRSDDKRADAFGDSAFIR